MYDEKKQIVSNHDGIGTCDGSGADGCSDKKAKEQEIQNKVAAIDTAYEAFTAEADHAKKLEAYKTMVSEDEPIQRKML